MMKVLALTLSIRSTYLTINLFSPLDLKITQVASLIGAQWRELGDEEKKPYLEQAAQDRERYDKEMQQYNQGTFQVR